MKCNSNLQKLSYYLLHVTNQKTIGALYRKQTAGKSVWKKIMFWREIFSFVSTAVIAQYDEFCFSPVEQTEVFRVPPPNKLISFPHPAGIDGLTSRFHKFVSYTLERSSTGINFCGLCVIIFQHKVHRGIFLKNSQRHLRETKSFMVLRVFMLKTPQETQKTPALLSGSCDNGSRPVVAFPRAVRL